MTADAILQTASRSWFWLGLLTVDGISATTPGLTNHLKWAAFSSETTAESQRMAGASMASGPKNLFPYRCQHPTRRSSQRKARNRKKLNRSRAERLSKLELRTSPPQTTRNDPCNLASRDPPAKQRKRRSPKRSPFAFPRQS